MDTKISTIAPSILRTALVAVGLASAWVLLTLLLGLGSSDAHADETDDGGATGGLLSSIVDAGTGLVADAGTGAIGAVTTVTGGVVQNAPVPAPVAAVAAPVTQAVSTVAGGVSGAVGEAAAGGIASPVATTVSGLVARTPVVGAVAATLGVDDALTSLGGGLDAAVADVAVSLAGTGAALELPAQPGSIPSPSGSSADAATADTGVLTATAVAGRLAAASIGASVASGWALLAESLPSAAATIVLSAAALAYFPLGITAPADASSTGPGGSGPGAWALLAFGPLVAYRAWVRRRGPDAERAPAAPSFATDVSPD